MLIWRYAVVIKIDGDIHLQPFDINDPSRFVIPPIETLPATAGAYELNPDNTRFVREFPYTINHFVDHHGVFRYGKQIKKLSAAGVSKRHMHRRNRKGSKKRGKSRKQSIRINKTKHL